MRAVVRALGCWSLGVLAALVLLEGLLRLLPVSSGLQPGPDPATWPLHNYEAHRPYRYSNTWAMLNAHSGVTNNYGHIADSDYRAGSRPLVVIGDSFVESLMNDHGDTLQGILGQRLGPSRPVYGLGASALSASDYLVLAGQAKAEFSPAAATFVIVDGDISESLLERRGGYFLQAAGSSFVPTYVPRTPDPTMQWVRAHIGELAIYSYVRSNLKFAPADLAGAFALDKRARSSVESDLGNYTRAFAVADWFLDGLPSASGITPRCTVLLLDADRYAIYDSRLATRPKDPAPLRAHFIDRARMLGYKVVDMAPLFKADYAQRRMKFDYWPADRHWSRHGHELAADAVMNALFSGEGNSCVPGGAAPAS